MLQITGVNVLAISYLARLKSQNVNELRCSYGVNIVFSL